MQTMASSSMSTIDFPPLPFALSTHTRPSANWFNERSADSRFVIDERKTKVLGKGIDALLNINFATKSRRRRSPNGDETTQWNESESLPSGHEFKSKKEQRCRCLRSLMANYEIQISEAKLSCRCLIRRRTLLLLGTDIYARTLWLTLRANEQNGEEKSCAIRQHNNIWRPAPGEEEREILIKVITRKQITFRFLARFNILDNATGFHPSLYPTHRRIKMKANSEKMEKL